MGLTPSEQRTLRDIDERLSKDDPYLDSLSQVHAQMSTGLAGSPEIESLLPNPPTAARRPSPDRGTVVIVFLVLFAVLLIITALGDGSSGSSPEDHPTPTMQALGTGQPEATSGAQAGRPEAGSCW